MTGRGPSGERGEPSPERPVNEGRSLPAEGPEEADSRPRPRLRGDLRVEECSHGNFVAQVIDSRLSRKVRLDRVALAVLRLIDGQRDPGSILVALELEGVRLRAPLLERLLDFFERNALLEGPRSEAILAGGSPESAESMTQPQHVVLRGDPALEPAVPQAYFLPEARHDCVGCGLCCSAYEFGPLTEEESRRLRAYALAEEGDRLQAPQSAADPVVEKERDGREFRTLAVTEDGSCVFLRQTKQCRIHEEKGRDRKPWFCQAFPLHFAVSPDGELFGYLQMECFSFHEARRRGPKLTEKVDDLRPVLAVTRDIPILPGSVQVGPSRTLSLKEYYRAEEWILNHASDTSRSSDAGSALRAAGELLEHIAAGGSAADYRLSEPERTLLPDDELVFEVARFARGSVTGVKPAALAGRPEGTSPGMQLFFLEALDFFSGEGDVDVLLPVEDVRGPETDPECAEILREYVRNEVFSREWYRCGDLRRGLAMMVVRYLIAVSGSRLLAHRWGETHASPRALCHSVSMVHRCLRRKRIEDFLCQEDSPLHRVYEALVRGCAGRDHGGGE